MVIKDLPNDSNAIPEACCWAGHSYYTLGKYTESIKCYQKVVDDYPDYHLAWHALFQVGRNYKKLKESGLISKSEADIRIKAAYEQILVDYPACPAAKGAEQWLSRQNSK